jgi:hypothetical protein
MVAGGAGNIEVAAQDLIEKQLFAEFDHGVGVHANIGKIMILQRTGQSLPGMGNRAK